MKRFRNLRTSQLISIKFTLSTIAVIFCFALIVNGVVFFLRYDKTQSFLSDISIKPSIINGNRIQISLPFDETEEDGEIMSLRHRERVRRPKGPKKPPTVEIIPLISPKAQNILQHPGYISVTNYDDEWIMYRVINKRMVAISVDDHMFLQILLLRSSLFLILAFALISYGLSLLFVKSILAKLNNVINQIQDKDILNHFSPIQYDGPDDDEIRIVVNTLNTALQRIHSDAQILKDFIAHAAHELKTPLMTISSIIDIALQQKDLNALSTIKPILHGQSELIDQLLLLAKYEHQNGKDLPLQKENIADVINSIIPSIQQHYQTKNITTKINLSDSVQSMIHYASFEILIKNLLDNAYHYTPDHGTVTITLDDTSLRISDTGIGIEAQHLDHIREKFRRGDSTYHHDDKDKHYGLGLSLCQTIARLHGFIVDVESTLGQGTTFTLSFSSTKKQP